jgi:hypothetical protein
MQTIQLISNDKQTFHFKIALRQFSSLIAILLENQDDTAFHVDIHSQ